MMRAQHWAILGASLALVCGAGSLHGQVTDGRVFLPTPDTISIFEFNSLPGVDGDPIPTGTVVPDLSGNGLDATVEGTLPGDLVVNPGDFAFDDPAGSNRECQRTAAGGSQMRVAVNNDRDAYEMEPEDSFTIELYVNRDGDNPGNWGILAGTWHSRNLIDDSVGDPDNNGAWYGYGLISNGGSPTDWGWVLSPVVDGVPRIGFGQGPEAFLDPVWFTLPLGRHYLVLSVDRTTQTAIAYMDSVEVGRLTLDPTWAFTTPPGRDHARFMMMNGENDSTLNTWMPSPPGTHLDAVRVQRMALTEGEIFEIWENIQAGDPSPPAEDLMQAIIISSTTSLIVGQCVRLDGSTSFPGGGETITTYAWKVGDGAFEEGEAVEELSFDSADPSDVTVSLRITNSASETSTADVVLSISNQEVVADFSVTLEGEELTGDLLLVPRGAELTLDGTASQSVVSDGALVCPLADNTPVPASPIAVYEWDLNGDGAPDETSPTVDLPPLDDLEEFAIELTVRNEAGGEDSVSVGVKVTDSGGNSNVFHTTDDTIFHVEFNDGEPGLLPDGTLIPDLSGNELNITIVDPVGDSIESVSGSTQFSTNRALRYVAGGSGPRGEVQSDGDLFEMTAEDDFTFEIYFRPGEENQPDWGGVTGTFRARTDGTDASERYGWGIIKTNQNSAEQGTQGFNWLVCSGLGQAAEKQAPFSLKQKNYSYVACVVDRVAQTSRVHVNGELAAEFANLDPAWSFETPFGLPHADFFVFTREQVEDQFANCPPGVSIDAIRLQAVALTPDDVLENWENIQAGRGANPIGVPAKVFHRGDPNDDGATNITDGIYLLNFLFLGGPGPTCMESADSNDDGEVNITDGIFILNFLFLGGPSPAPPGPATEPCGRDPAESPDIGCDSTTSC